jgi:ACS family glucarate transporter-like MFS transporter
MFIGSVPLVFATGQVRVLAASAMAVPALWVVRSLLGVVSAPLHPGAARLVWTWTPLSWRSAGNGLVTAAALLAYAATPRLFGAMMDRWDWPTAFAICSIVTAVLAVVWIACAGDDPRRHPWANDSERELLAPRPTPIDESREAQPIEKAPDELAAVDDANPYAAPRVSNPSATPPIETPWWTLLTNRSLMLLTVSFAAVGYFEYLFFYWMEHYFNQELGMSTSQSRNYTSVPMLAMAAGMFLGGWLSDQLSVRLPPRVGRVIVPMGGMLFSAVFLGLGVAAAVNGKEPIWIVTAFSLAMAALGGSEATFWSTAVELGGRRGGTAAAILNTGGNAGGVLSPVLTPWIGERYGWPVALGVAGASCLVGAALWLGVRTARTTRDG